MFAFKKIEELRDLLKKEKSMKVSEISRILDVNSVTIRKYLEQLQQEGFLIKTHGGAVLVEEKPSFHENPAQSILNYEQKNQIANLAVSRIEKGDSIFLGSGATCYLIAQKLKNVENVTVVTNNITAVNEIVTYCPNVFVIGGEIVYRDGMISSSWEKAEEYLKNIYVNKAFTSAVGVDMIAGITVNHMVSSYIYKFIPKITSNWYLVAEKSKLGRRGLYQVANVEDVKYIITNRIEESYRTQFEQKGVTVIS